MTWKTIGPDWSWVHDTNSFIHRSGLAVVYQHASDGSWYLGWHDGKWHVRRRVGPCTTAELAAQLLPASIRNTKSEWNAGHKGSRSSVHGRAPEDVLA